MWWKILLIVIAIPIALIVITVVVGLFFPRGHTATRSVHYAKPASDVWAVISDFASHTKWRTNLKSIERLDDHEGQPVWREVHGKGDRFDMQVIEFESPRRMVTQIVDHSQFGGTWTWVVEPDAADPSACTFTITEDGEVYNPIFRTVARFFMGYRATMDGVHRALAKHLGVEIDLDAPME